MKSLYLSNYYLISTILSQITIAIFVATRWFNLFLSLLLRFPISFFFQPTWAPERRHGVSSTLPFSPLVVDPLGTALIRYQPQRMAIRTTNVTARSAILRRWTRPPSRFFFMQPLCDNRVNQTVREPSTLRKSRQKEIDAPPSIGPIL